MHAIRSSIIWPANFISVLRTFLTNTLQRRHLIWSFALRDLKGRFVGSLGGVLWAVVHPLVLLISYNFIFGRIFRARVPDGLEVGFPIYLFAGILPWLYFQDTLLRSSSCILDNANLVRKTVFPTEVLPVSLALSNLIMHLMTLLVLLLILASSGQLFWTALLVPLYLVLMLLLLLGMSWFAAALQVFLRDTAQVLTVALILWFWFTPIFYEREQLPDWLRPWMSLNPMTYVVEGYRDLLLRGQIPHWESVARLAICAVFAFVIGGAFFRSTKREFVDVL